METAHGPFGHHPAPAAAAAVRRVLLDHGYHQGFGSAEDLYR